MALTDLTGTTWRLNSELTSYPGGTHAQKTYSLDITTSEPVMSIYDGTTSTGPFTAIRIGYDSGGEYNDARLLLDGDSYPGHQIAAGNDTKMLPDTWNTWYTGEFTVSGGVDATNAVVIAWFEDNCAEVEQPDVAVVYNGSNIVELTDSATKTLKTAGKYLVDDIVLTYSKASGGGWEAIDAGIFDTSSVDGEVTLEAATNGTWVFVQGEIGESDLEISSISLPYGSPYEPDPWTYGEQTAAGLVIDKETLTCNDFLTVELRSIGQYTNWRFGFSQVATSFAEGSYFVIAYKMASSA